MSDVPADNNAVTAADAVRIVVDDNVATIGGPINRIVPFLGCHRRGFEFGSAGKLRQQHQPAPFIWLNAAGRPVISPGLVPFVVEQLRNEGVEVEVIDRRVWPAEFAPDQHVLDQADDADRSLLDAISSHRRGQIQVRGLTDLVHNIALIARLHPERSILIIAPTRKRAWQIWQELRWILRARIQLSKGAWSTNARIVVTTPCYLRQPREWDIVLLPDALALTGIQMIGKVFTALGGPKLIFAFTPANARLSRFQRLAIQNVSGPVIYRLVPEPADVHVRLIKSCSSPGAAKLQGLERKRKAYWFNDRRNDDIAGFATAVDTSDRVTLRQDYGLVLGDAGDSTGAVPDPLRVCIIVESMEHGQQLLRRLPGWHLLHNGQDGFVAGAVSTIVTFSYVAQHGIDAEVVIRADGGSDQLPIRNFPPAATESGNGTLLVDVDDDFDKLARRQTEQRVDGYARRGWVITDLTGLRRDPATHLYSPELLETIKSAPATNLARTGSANTSCEAGTNPTTDSLPAHHAQQQHKCQVRNTGNQPVRPRTQSRTDMDPPLKSRTTQTPADGIPPIQDEPSIRPDHRSGLTTDNGRTVTNHSTPARKEDHTQI